MNKLYFLLIFPCIVYSELKIYDCFTFFNEIELLKIRFEELYNVVDKFVLVEATQTFTGEPKELFFLKNKNLFSKYEDKIIHVVVDDLEKIKGKTANLLGKGSIIKEIRS